MKDIVITLVYMIVLVAFSIWPAIKIVEFIGSKKELKPKIQNFLTLFFTLLIALLGALFMKLA
jgi:uncharacterized membrane protein (UPF0182 family)